MLNIEISKKSLVYNEFSDTEFSSFEEITTKLKTPIFKKDNFKNLEEKEVERKKQEVNFLLNLDLDFRKIISILNNSKVCKDISENKTEEKKEKDNKTEIYSKIIRLEENSIEKLERISNKIMQRISFSNKLLSSIKSNVLKAARSAIKSQINTENINTSLEKNIYLLWKYNLSIDLDQLIDLIDREISSKF